MLEFEKKTLAFIEKHGLLIRGDKVCAAVSGGPDSMALLDFLAKRMNKFDIELAAAHVDHMLRGKQSKMDLEYVRSYCEQNNIPFFSASIDIKQKMKQDKKGVQETAREYRYLFFADVMKQMNATKLAVGQHADDQMETILMRLTRGSSGKARAGIQTARSFSIGTLIRPLLGVTKEQIEEYCAFYQLKPRRDPSNEHRDYTRNRFRLEILPVLKKENEQVHEHFQRFSEDILQDEAFLEEMAKRETEKLIEKEKDEIRVSIPAFLKMPLPLQRRGIHLILSYLYKKNIGLITTRHLSSIDQLIKGVHPSGKLNLPLGLHVIRSYETCRFRFGDEERPLEYYGHLHVGDKVAIPNQFTIHLDKAGNQPIQEKDDFIILDPASIQLPLTVRTRVPGDRMRLKGMNGSKKIKDIFIDEKIPLAKRDSWPIVTDAAGRILWVPGVKKSCYDLSPQKNESYYICIAKQPGRQQSQ
ncbi:tRNA lysidine(34) synthetase TilS [Siminovitchia sp. 179-K 8D1 HS]|uniref:tRNA lysidine(34) synthetase TilS n=1 Tax=Siminovitchia sp. 179-K 8D1 HS TaxID=3142385 RepID=UPI00399EF58B